ncbi:hypothetical protein TNCV_2996141 [Trichonephila clavipes]|nr:hypothetical protein TNCV_2996141 [Trichonephila clavipes]
MKKYGPLVTFASTMWSWSQKKFPTSGVVGLSPSATEDLPCMGLMYVKSFEVQSPHVYVETLGVRFQSTGFLVTSPWLHSALDLRRAFIVISINVLLGFFGARMAILSNQLEKNVRMQIRNLIYSRSLAFEGWLCEVAI